jgi:hypothetical protein
MRVDTEPILSLIGLHEQWANKPENLPCRREVKKQPLHVCEHLILELMFFCI